MHDHITQLYLSHLNNQKSIEQNFILPISQVIKDCYLSFDHLFEQLKKTCADCENQKADLHNSRKKYYKDHERILKAENEMKNKMVEFDQGTL